MPRDLASAPAAVAAEGAPDAADRAIRAGAFLGARRKPSLGETVRAWRDYLPAHLPLPHPSPRNVGWFKANPWFEEEVLPVLRARVHALLAAPRARA